MYIDSIYVGRASAATLGLSDLTSVEILRGPQGTLFGRASNGGAVLFTPRGASSDKGYVSLQYGNYNDMEVEAAVSIPIASDVLSARVAGSLVRRDGYTKVLNQSNYDLDDKQSQAIRVTLDFTPTETISNRLIFDYVDIDQHQGSWLLLAARPGGLASQVFNPANPLFQQFLAANSDLAAIPGYSDGIQGYLETIREKGPRKVYLNTPNDLLIFRNRTLNLINTTEVELGAIKVKNIFGYQELYSALGYEADGSPFPLLDGYRASFAPTARAADKHQFSNELQISGSFFNDRLDLMVGGYFQNRKDNEPGNTLFGQALAIFGGGATQVLNSIDEKSRAVFTQGTFKITDSLRLTAGYRHTWDKIDVQQYLAFTPRTQRGLASGPTVCPGTNIPFSVDAAQCRGPFSALRPEGDNWTVGLDWQPTDDMLLYAAAKRGYRPGGVSTTAAVPALREFLPETITEYEAGLKTSFDFGPVRGRFNVSAFYQTIDEAQRGFVIFNTATNQAQSITLNAEKAEVKGIEVETDFRFGSNFRLSIFGDYTDAGYKAFQVPIVGADPTVPGGLAITGYRDASANPFPNVPKWHAGVNATYILPLPSHAGELSVTGNYYYQSEYFFSTDAENEPEARAAGRGLVNARLDWKNILGGPVDASLWVKNLFDKEYLRGGIGIQQLIGITQATPGEPRTYGLQLRYNF